MTVASAKILQKQTHVKANWKPYKIKTKNTTCEVNQQLPIVVYIGLPDTFKSFCIKVKDRSSYSIDINLYRSSPNPYSWICKPKDDKNDYKWFLYKFKYAHIHDKNDNSHPPFVLTSRMCPTPNPNNKTFQSKSFKTIKYWYTTTKTEKFLVAIKMHLHNKKVREVD
jgi:hypothetical protein